MIDRQERRGENRKKKRGEEKKREKRGRGEKSKAKQRESHLLRYTGIELASLACMYDYTARDRIGYDRIGVGIGGGIG